MDRTLQPWLNHRLLRRPTAITKQLSVVQPHRLGTFCNINDQRASAPAGVATTSSLDGNHSAVESTKTWWRSKSGRWIQWHQFILLTSRVRLRKQLPYPSSERTCLFNLGILPRCTKSSTRQTVRSRKLQRKETRQIVESGTPRQQPQSGPGPTKGINEGCSITGLSQLFSAPPSSRTQLSF